jgi:sugar-specific transcriptional regulator TrmB
LSADITRLEEVLSSELKLSTNESKTFLLIVKNGKMTPDQISKSLQITLPDALKAADSLVKKGMLIEISLAEYESLHPRFAASNRYRILCEEENIEFKKNIRVDNIGLVLESHYENARTK